jgi:dipeptidyl aminopeptidase/acylaminoacyl peptidase
MMKGILFRSLAMLTITCLSAQIHRVPPGFPTNFRQPGPGWFVVTYLASDGSARMVFLDANLLPQDEETLGLSPKLLFTSDSSMLFVLYHERQGAALTSYVGMIDLKRQRHVGAVPLPEAASGNGPQDLALSVDGKRLYIITSKRHVVRSPPPPTSDNHVVVATDWINDYDESVLYIFDTVARQFLPTPIHNVQAGSSAQPTILVDDRRQHVSIYDAYWERLTDYEVDPNGKAIGKRILDSSARSPVQLANAGLVHVQRSPDGRQLIAFREEGSVAVVTSSGISRASIDPVGKGGVVTAFTASFQSRKLFVAVASPRRPESLWHRYDQRLITYSLPDLSRMSAIDSQRPLGTMAATPDAGLLLTVGSPGLIALESDNLWLAREISLGRGGSILSIYAVQ